MDEGGDIQKHFSQLKELFVDLSRMSDPVNENDKTGTWLRSLSTTMSFIAVVVQENNMTYADLCAFLKSEDERQKPVKPSHGEPPPVQPTAHFSHSNKHHEGKNHRRNLITCWYCGKRGHVQGECRLRQRR